MVSRLLVLILATAAALLHGQSESAMVMGSVMDPTGAFQRTAVVTAVNEDTGVRVQALTSEDGQYSFPALRPGRWSITATAPGFKQYVQSGMLLQVGQTLRADIRMELGSVSEHVNVTAESPMLESETSARGVVIDTRKIVELPLNGRDYNQLATLSPGVLLPTPRLQSIEFKGAFNVNGNRAFPERVPARRRGQHVLLELFPGRQHAGGAALGRCAAGVPASRPTPTRPSSDEAPGR